MPYCLLCFNFFLGWFCLFVMAETDKHTAQGVRMPVICLVLTEFAVQFTNADVRVSVMVVSNLSQFLLRVGVWMWTARTVSPIEKRFLRAVIFSAPPHERCLRDMIPATDNAHVPVCRYNCTAYILVLNSWGRYLLLFYLLCATISMAIESFRWVLLW